jgi:hypothetical protein
MELTVVVACSLIKLFEKLPLNVSEYRVTVFFILHKKPCYILKKPGYGSSSRDGRPLYRTPATVFYVYFEEFNKWIIVVKH